MANKSRETANLVSSTGISTLRTEFDIINGPVQIGTASSTGTVDQKLQVTGGAYVSGSVGIATTNPNSRLEVYGDGRRINVVNSPVWLRPNTGGSIGTALSLGVFDDNPTTSAWDINTADTYFNTAEFLDASDLIDIRSNRYNAYIHISSADPVGVRTAFSIRHHYPSQNNEIRIHDGGQPATRVRLASNDYSFFTNAVGIGSTIPKSFAKLDVLGDTNVSGLTSTGTIKVGTAGTALQIFGNGHVAFGTDAATPQNTNSLILIDANRVNKIPLYFSHSAESYSKVMGSSGRADATYSPPGTAMEIVTNSNSSLRTSNLINFNTYNGTLATGLYLGAHAGTNGNGPADFVLGRRTAVTTWSETLRITHSASGDQQYLGFGTQNVPTNDPIYIAGSIHQRPYGIANTRTGLTTAFDDSNNYKMKLLATNTSSTGIAGIQTSSTFGTSPDQFDYVRRHFSTGFTSGVTAFNQNICEIDCSGGSFQQFGIYIVWGTRIQQISDGTTQANQRLYGVNKFNTTTGAFTISSYLANVNASSSAHMDIEVVDKGSGVLAIQYQQSASPGVASFIGGYVEIFSVGNYPSFGSPAGGIVKWNV